MSDISELIKVGNPFNNNSMHRSSYYANVKFSINDIDIKIPAKVDTGASYTVIGLENNRLKNFVSDIKRSNITQEAFDASNTQLNLYGYIVNNFELTQDIIIPKIQLFFSEDIGKKALIGMDILSLFEFNYKREKRSTNGTFWIYNYKSALDELHERMVNKDLAYIDPFRVLDIEETDNSSDHKGSKNTGFTMRDAEAAYVHKMINEHDNKKDT